MCKCPDDEECSCLPEIELGPRTIKEELPEPPDCDEDEGCILCGS